MRTPFKTGAAAALLVGGALAATGHVYADDAEHHPPDVVDCTTYDETLHRGARTLDMHVANSCPKAMACTVSWTVTCAKVVTDHSDTKVLVAGGERTWTASAARCEKEWAIDTRWQCNEAGP